MPRVPVIDEQSCVQLNSGACGTCATVCGVGAIHYDHMRPKQRSTSARSFFRRALRSLTPTCAASSATASIKTSSPASNSNGCCRPPGPTSGTVARPGDGKHPKKIAWIQCVGSRDHTCNRDYCSSVCCMYATKEAYIAREHDSSIEPTIFYIDMRSFGKNFDAYISPGQGAQGALRPGHGQPDFRGSADRRPRVALCR